MNDLTKKAVASKRRTIYLINLAEESLSCPEFGPVISRDGISKVKKRIN